MVVTRRTVRAAPAVALVAAMLAASVGCSEERSTRNRFVDPICLDFPWAALSAVQPGQPPPDLDCKTTLDCPPPLTCQPRPGSGTGACVLLKDAPDPSAPSEVYEVPEFLLSVTEGDDYNLLEFNGLPPSATVLRCVFHICPVDADVLRDAPGRCEYADQLVNLGLTGGLALPVVATGPDSLDVQAPIPACGSDATTAGQTPRAFRIAAVGYFAVCYAFSETELVAVSAISNLSRGEVGSAGQDAYQAGCAGESAREGAACVYTRADGRESLGVCVGGACCAPCWADEDCRAFQGETCHGIQRLREPTDGRVGAAISGWCPDVECVDRNGVAQCVERRPDAGSDALADGGVPDAGAGRDAGVDMALDDDLNAFSAWRAAPRAGASCDAGVEGADRGVDQRPEVGVLPDAAPMPDAGPPDMAPADAPDQMPRPRMP